MLNWDDLKVALAIARAGSLSRAAVMLGMDQSTAGRRLGALEAQIGAILFQRSKAGLKATEAGEAVIRHASEVELRIGRIVEDVSRQDDSPVGSVRLIGNAWMLQRLTTTVLPAFLAANPRLDMRLIGRHPDIHAREEPTVSIWFEAPPRQGEFAIEIARMPYAVYAPRGVDPDTLGWVAFLNEDSPRRAPNRLWERLRRPGERIRMTATDSGMLLSGVEAGIGKALLPVCIGDEAPGLVRVGAGPPDLVRTLHLHAHPDTVQARRIQATIRWLREAVGEVFGALDVPAPRTKKAR